MENNEYIDLASIVEQNRRLIKKIMREKKIDHINLNETKINEKFYYKVKLTETGVLLYCFSLWEFSYPSFDWDAEYEINLSHENIILKEAYKILKEK